MNSSPERRPVIAALLVALSLSVAAQPVIAAAPIDTPLAVRMAAHPGAAQVVLVRLRAPESSGLLRMLAPTSQRPAHAAGILRTAASRSQAALSAWLAGRDIPARPYWLGNMIRIEATPPVIDVLSMRDDVAAILLDRPWRQALPVPQPVAGAGGGARAIEASLAHIRVPPVWQAGIRGHGVVIAGQDTGYQWDHPALRASYRGWNGAVADHDHHWHDAIHALIGVGSNSCGLDLQAPCDDGSHGTHTMGTMVGDDGGANQIGIAPDARWIGCRNMEEGDGTPSTYTECFQWFIEPTRLDGSDPDASLAPHVINNSWGCPLSEGCTPLEIDLMEDVVGAVRSAGILVVASAGNSGPSCATIDTPPGRYATAFAVGATSVPDDAIAGFSSRGPAPGNLLKPDVTAPGVSIRSSVTGNGYGVSSGTSMAGPHVAGVAALLMSVDASLRRDPSAVEAILRATAVPLASAQDCGGYVGTTIPNATFGHGRIDAWAAFRMAETILVDGFE